MTASLREAVAGLRARLDERRDDPGLPALAGELYAAVDLIDGEPVLRAALSDAGQPAQARVATVHSLFDSRLSPLAVDVLADVAGQRWPDGASMVDAIEQLAAQSAFVTADREGSLDAVEDELFGFTQGVSSSAELQLALTDPASSTAAKAALVGSLLEGRAGAATTQVLSHALSHLRGRRADTVLDGLTTLAAEQRGRSVAEVRSAIALTPDQAGRLTAALSRRYERDIRLNVAVDPTVIGGISVRVGTEVIDGTMATRIEQARRALAG